VNPDTVALVTRPYLQLVDDLLTAVAGGVVNERILYDVKSDAYALAEPARDVRSVTGTVGGEAYAFQPLVDFVFSEGDNSLVWEEGGTAPDDETSFFVDYFRVNSRSPLTDLNVGSVTRTLVEAIGREIASVYAEINRAYLSAFIDTAEGTSLELVVSILDATRKTAEYAEGLVTFFRAAGADGAIAIPQGTLLATTSGDATFVTAQPRTLQRGQARVDVPVRASEASRGEPGKQPAGAIAVMAQPIEGIARITNLDATTLPAEDETDAELRERAKARLRGLGKATLAALAQAVFEGGAQLVEVWDPNGPPAKRSPLGAVSMLIEVEPERFASVAGEVHETRAAGVQATLVARYVFFKPRIVGTLDAGLTAAGKAKVVDEAIAALQTYVDGLGAGEPAEGAAMLAAIASVREVHEPKFVDVIAWRSEVGDPSGSGFVDVLQAVTLAPAGDEAALRTALERALLEAAPTAPSARRTADRSLVQGAGGARALDAEVESGEFTVAPVDETWWVVLDVEPADIALEEA
jgi:uncharacterized phage protein gp47/JayE